MFLIRNAPSGNEVFYETQLSRKLTFIPLRPQFLLSVPSGLSMIYSLSSVMNVPSVLTLSMAVCLVLWSQAFVISLPCCTLMPHWPRHCVFQGGLFILLLVSVFAAINLSVSSIFPLSNSLPLICHGPGNS